MSGWYGVVNSGAINAANPATILALVIGASGNTDARAYSIAASTGYFFQIGSGATTSSKLRIVYRSPSKDLIGGETSSIVFENGVPHVAALRYTPGLFESFVDGKADLTLADTASGTTSGTLWASTNTLWRGSAATQNNTSVVLGLFWSRALSDAEIKSISQNPWQIFKPIPRRIFAPVSAGGTPTLYPSLYTNDQEFYAHTLSQSGGTQTLTPSLFTDSSTFYSHTLAPGAVTAAPGLYNNDQTFYSLTLTTSKTLAATRFDNDQTVFTPVVTQDGGPQYVAPNLFENTQSYFAHSVSVGQVQLYPLLLDNAQVFYAATVSSQAQTIARPSADTSNTGWTPSTGSDLYAMIDEVTPDDADYISTASAGSVCRLGLGAVADPGTSSGQVVSYRASSSTGNGLLVELMQGVTVIATWNHASLPATDTTYQQSLSAAECDAITDYTALSVRLTSL